MAKPQNQPRSAGENSRTAANVAAADATKGEHEPVPATQDPNLPDDEGETEAGPELGTPSGLLDQDRDGTAETPEVGQEHAPTMNKPRPLRREPLPSPVPLTPGVRMPGQNPRQAIEDPSVKPLPKPSLPPAFQQDESQDRPVRVSGRAFSTPSESHTMSFEQVCEEIGKGIKKLTEAGMGGGEAGKLACRLWCQMNGGGNLYYPEPHE